MATPAPDTPEPDVSNWRTDVGFAVGVTGNPRTILSTRSSMYGKELRERPWYRPSTRDLSALRLRDQTLPTRSLRGKPASFVNRMQSSPFRNLSGTVSKSWCTVADASNGGV